jgi:hypothetical protein
LTTAKTEAFAGVAAPGAGFVFTGVAAMLAWGVTAAAVAKLLVDAALVANPPVEAGVEAKLEVDAVLAAVAKPVAGVDAGVANAVVDAAGVTVANAELIAAALEFDAAGGGGLNVPDAVLALAAPISTGGGGLFAAATSLDVEVGRPAACAKRASMLFTAESGAGLGGFGLGALVGPG